MLHQEQPVPTQDWPEHFQRRFGRKLRVLHIGNIANYAWTNASLMREAGADCIIIDPDSYHLLSSPEWTEARISGDVGDPFYPQWHKADVKGFCRPDWYMNGPTPFLMRELAAAESRNPIKQWFFAVLSRFYRRCLASPANRPSFARRILESRIGPAVLAKKVARLLTLGTNRRSSASQNEALSESRQSTAKETTIFAPASDMGILKVAFQRFDIVIGYALGSRFAAAIDFERYVSLEIGTLRGLVFEPTETGKLAAALYRASPFVFITNVDCVDAAIQLQIPKERIVALPHPFNLPRAEKARREMSDTMGHGGPAPAAPDGIAGPYFLCPARHHWRNGNASWLKGNDILIRGAAMVARQRNDFRMVFFDWGEETGLSRALVDELGLANRVTWLPPLTRIALWPWIMGASAVVDQFAASAFGGVALESMALGKPVISRLDQTSLEPFFRSPPPIMAASTPDEVAQRLLEVLNDSDDHAGWGKRGADWMAREHGVDQQLSRQFAAFSALIDKYGTALT